MTPSTPIKDQTVPASLLSLLLLTEPKTMSAPDNTPEAIIAAIKEQAERRHPGSEADVIRYLEIHLTEALNGCGSAFRQKKANELSFRNPAFERLYYQTA